MSVPTPAELITKHGRRMPEQLAALLGMSVKRVLGGPSMPGVQVLSAYEPTGHIVLYTAALRRLASERKEPLPRLEQWHIAHELYHALAEHAGASAWRVRETEADVWADELLSLVSRASARP